MCEKGGKGNLIGLREMPWRRFRRRVVSWTGLFLLSFNILAGVFVPQPSFAKLLGGDEGHYLICTAIGLIEIDENGKQVSSDQSAAGVDLCVYCFPLMNGAADTPQSFTVAEAQLLASGTILPVCDSQQSLSPRLSWAAGPRAPPTL